jgi:membrane protein implicated in regulation of membrane protease activity
MEPFQISLVIAFTFAVVEVMTLTFIFLSFALAFLVIALFQFLTGEFSINRDIGIFAAFSIFFTVFFRGLFRRRKDQVGIRQDDDVNSY